jgi:hypothetical protein
MRVITLFTAVIALSTVAFAEDKKPSNVYEWFGELPKASPDVRPVTPEEITADIKRHMANLLYPVDMSSLAPPDKDPKFHDLIAVLQQQMGDPPTGVLTTDQFGRLAQASHNIDLELIALSFSKKHVHMYDTGMFANGNAFLNAEGTGSWDNMNPRDDRPLNAVRIVCYEARALCERHTAHLSFDDQVRVLSLNLHDGDEYQITSWSSSQVTAESQAPCFTDLMTVDIKPEQVTTVRVPQPYRSSCSGFQPPDRQMTWKLVDGFEVAEKFRQEKMNKARKLVYPAARALLR